MVREATDAPELRERRYGKPNISFILLNIAILVGAALFLVAVDASTRRRVETETLRNNKFLTTEWRLMKELKDRTDRQLRDKDREIAELRKRYLSLKESGSPIELLEAIENEMLRAEAEREAILSTRLMAAAAPPVEPPSAAPPSIDAAPATLFPGASRTGGTDTALSELLRIRIQGLEESLRVSLKSEAAYTRELDKLRMRVAELEAVSAAPSPADAPAPAPVAGPADSEKSGEPVELIESMLAALAIKRDALADTGAVLGLSDLKTRALLRAIVRTPAIRSEYPDLQEAFDRYLLLAGKEEYNRGMRDTYADAMRTLEALTGKQWE